jgi:hypothetical protein
MSVHGQKEFVITLRREEQGSADSVPRFVIQLLTTILNLAKQGRLVNEGDYTSMMLTNKEQETGLAFNLLYLPPVHLAGIPLPSPVLAVRLMSAEEYKFFQSYGAMRLLSSWAHRYLYFPYPPWSEIPAPETVSLDRFQSSILNKSQRAYIVGATASLEGEEIVLRLHARVRGGLQRNLMAMPPAQPIAFLLNLDPKADASLAWLPEQNQTTMNITPASKFARVAGCFVQFIPQQATPSARIYEDGFAVLLPTDTWVDLRTAMFSGQPMTVPTAGKRFRLEHLGTPSA